jgi:type III secretion HrpO family protein
MTSTSEALLHLAGQGLLLVLVVSAPPLLAALAVSLVTGVLQAATQIQDQTLGVVPRLAAVAVALLLAAPWMGAQLLRFTEAILEVVVVLGQRGG